MLSGLITNENELLLLAYIVTQIKDYDSQLCVGDAASDKNKHELGG